MVVLSNLVCRHCVCDDAHIVEVLRVQRNTLMEECLRKDDRHIEYHGLTYSTSSLARKLLEADHALAGPAYWTYQGKTLRDIRTEREEQGSYK